MSSGAAISTPLNYVECFCALIWGLRLHPWTHPIKSAIFPLLCDRQAMEGVSLRHCISKIAVFMLDARQAVNVVVSIVMMVVVVN